MELCPFYAVSMKLEVTYPIQRVNTKCVTSRGLTKMMAHCIPQRDIVIIVK